MQEATIPTLVDLLEEHLTRPDVIGKMKQYDQTVRVFWDLAEKVGMLLQRAAQSPPSPGYEPWLTDHDINPIPARMMAALVVRHGNRRSEESARLPAVIKAMRFLADPTHRRRAKSHRVDALLAAWNETSIIETIFAARGLNEFEFIRLLESAAKGDDAAYDRLGEIAASLIPRLSISRGRKISAESAAHEFFLENAVMRMESRAYSWNDLQHNFTDPVTEATRREFDSRDFDPRAAYRRVKARQK